MRFNLGWKFQLSEFNFDLYQIHPAEGFFSIDKQSKSYSYFAANMHAIVFPFAIWSAF